MLIKFTFYIDSTCSKKVIVISVLESTRPGSVPVTFIEHGV